MENDKILVYVNGQLEDKTSASVSATADGFKYGYGLFETLRVYGRKTFRLERHISRLLSSARKIDLPLDSSAKDLEDAVVMTIDGNRINDGSIRLTVSKATDSKSDIVVEGGHLDSRHLQTHQQGYRTVISKFIVHPQLPLIGMKTSNFLPYILARKEAHSRAADESILLNVNGTVAEGSVSNIFILQKNVIFTPPRESGILPGITREAVLELAPTIGFDVKEQSISVAQLKRADEVFLTNSLIEIMPVISVDGAEVGMGNPGDAALKILSAYRRLVELELR